MAFAARTCPEDTVSQGVSHIHVYLHIVSQQTHNVQTTSLQRRCNVVLTHNVQTTSLQRRCNVVTLQRRCNDVVVTLCVCWASLPGYIQLEKSLSPLKIERCSLVFNFVMLSRFHCREWLNTCRQDIETPTLQKHALSDLGPFESFVNIGTFLEQIAIIEMFSKFRKFPDCACLQRANSPRDIIE